MDWTYEEYLEFLSELFLQKLLDKEYRIHCLKQQAKNQGN